MIPLSWRRGVFLSYALAVVTATHWPNLQLPNVVPRTDLWIHFTCFSLWLILAAFAAWFGQALSRRNLARTFAMAFVYIFVDEFTQGIPILHRTVDWTDIVANFMGLCIGMGILLLLRRTALRLVLGTR